jgi:hypothetical protein
MPVRFLSDAELARLSGWPGEVADEDLVTFFTLTDDDLAWLGASYRLENRLGVAVQLCTLPWLGWVPDDLAGCPSTAIARLAAALAPGPGDASGLLASYGGWQGRTRASIRSLIATPAACATSNVQETGRCSASRGSVVTDTP